MKKLLSLMLLPLFAIMFFVGCNSDKTVADIKKSYSDLISSFVVDGENVFFSNDSNPKMLVIKYPSSIEFEMEIESPANADQKRIKGLYYQNKLLTNVFQFYVNNEETFYTKMPSANVDNDELNNLYNQISSLKSSLETFKPYYLNFTENVKNGTSNVMDFVITSYTYQLNKVIESSISFIDTFSQMYFKYCGVENNLYKASDIKSLVDKAYFDISNIVYLQNFKAFNKSVSGNGLCDMSKVVGANTDYNLIHLLDNRKDVSMEVLENLTTDSEKYAENIEKISQFVYNKDVFDQRVGMFEKTYNSLDVNQLSKYKFDTLSSMDYESYLNTLSVSNRSSVEFLDNFINDTFLSYVEKLNNIVE